MGSVLILARDCLKIQGRVSVRDDILGLRDLPPPRSLKSELRFVRQTRCRPRGPSDLKIVRVREGAIDISWTDQSDNETGFRIRFRGERAGFADDTGERSTAPNQTNSSITGLKGGFRYTISVVAFNAGGESTSSNQVEATTPNEAAPNEEETVTLQLARQNIVQGFVPYLGEFPKLGTSRGRLRRIKVPQVGLSDDDLVVRFVKLGHSTLECGNSDALVAIAENQSTTPAQVKSIFGVEEPKFDTFNHLVFVACVGVVGATAPNNVDIELTVIFD